MDGITDHATTTAEVRERPHIPSSAVRPEILEVLRQGPRRDSDRTRQNYQDAFDRLFAHLGQSHEMAIASWFIASNVAKLIGDRDPRGWRWGGNTYGDPSLENAVREFKEFERLFFNRARKLLSTATQMQGCVTVYDKMYHKALADLIEALHAAREHEPQTHDPNGTPRPNSLPGASRHTFGL
jgi:hypothetical protein